MKGFFQNFNINIDITNIPFAGFEIEGSTTSSKNQIGNLTNLMIDSIAYKFIITNNKEAGNENDIYHRGIKIVRSFQEMIGRKKYIVVRLAPFKNV